MKTAKAYRETALEVLRGNWKPYVLTSLALLVIVLLMEFPLQLAEHLEVSNATTTVLTLGVYLVMILLYFPVVYAFLVGCVDKYRGEATPIMQLTCSIFKTEYSRGTCSYLLIMALAFLIALPLIIVAAFVAVAVIDLGVNPAEGLAQWIKGNAEAFMGIYMACMLVALIPLYIWAYAVMLTTYLAHDCKELGIRACMKESKRLMKGHKWQAFCLQLSFVGWGMLSVLTLGIGLLWLLPYQSVAMAAFYEDVRKEDDRTNGGL